MKSLNNFKNVSIMGQFLTENTTIQGDSNWNWNIIINLQNIKKYKQIHKANIFKRLL